MRSSRSPSSSEGALTSLKLDLPIVRRRNGGEAMRNLDSFLEHLGNPGRFQIVVMILLASNCIPVVVNHLLMAFYAIPAPHHCRVPDDFVGNKSTYLPLKSDLVSHMMSPANSTAPRAEPAYEECEMYVNPQNHSLGLQKCVYGYEFHVEDKEWNVVTEWGLVCDRSFVGPLMTTVYFCGVMLGGVVFGSLSDRFGRKSMMLVCLYTQCIIGIGLHFVRRLIVFMGLRFIQGIFIQGLQCVTYSMVMELFSPHYRTLAGCVVEAFWALGIIMLAVIAKFVQHWRYIQLAINIPTLATFFYIWIIPESVRWLVSRGKLRKAEEVVIRIASYNSLRLDRSWLRDEIHQVGRALNVGENNDYHRKPGLRDVFSHPSIRSNAFVMFFIWFSVSSSYYGISYSIPNLSGDRYLNFMIGGGIELAAYILAFVILNNFGRKVPLMIYLLISGLLCIAIVVSKKYVPPSAIDLEGLSIALALIGKAAVVSCFCSIFIYSNEIFPTVIRTVSVGSCAFFGRVGSLLAPQILLLGKYVNEESPELITFSTFGALSILAGLMVLLLPETMDQDLPDTVSQADHMVKEARRRSSSSSILRRYSRRHFSRHDEDDASEVGYGKSPEWVEVDGMIVSRGVLENRTGSLGLRGPTVTTVGPKASDQYQRVVGGSVLSLNYSNRTLLTNSSRSTGYETTGHQTHHQLHRFPSHMGYVQHHNDDLLTEEEPPYETLPNIDLTAEEISAVEQTQSLQDTSVISAHQDVSGLYDRIKGDHGSISHIILASDLGDETRL